MKDYKKDYRKDFPLLQAEKTFYLDNAATAQKPQTVIDAESEFYELHNANPLRGFYPLSMDATNIYEESRVKVQKFINAKSEKEIIFTRNTTESMNLIAFSYGFSKIQAGDEIIVSIAEHHSNMLPWRMVADAKGAIVKYLECDIEGNVTNFDEVFSDRTRLVAVNQVSNVLGKVNPVEKIIKKAHEVGAVVVIDAAQSAPHMKIDVQVMDADFVAFSGHKLFGPMGIGVLYGKEKILKSMPPFMQGGEMIDAVHRDSVKYAELPHKFEAGTVNAAGAAGLAAAIDYIESVGFETMEELELELTTQAMEGISNIPHVHVLGSPRPEDHTGIITFVIDDVHPHDVSAILEADGIDVRAGHHCAQPLLEHLGIRSATRASIMFYNTKEEIDALIKSISTVRERLGFGD